MDIKINIQYKDEELEGYLTFEKGKEYVFFAKDKIVSESIYNLDISNEFKERMNRENLRICMYNAIPYDFYSRTGLEFSFDYNEFVYELKIENLWGDWRKLREVYGGDLPLLERKIITPEKILNAIEEIV